MKTPPIGIVRTLPPIYADPEHEACINYRAAIADQECTWFLALAQQPKHDLLYVYIVIKGRIDARFNFAGIREGGRDVRLWDGTVRTPKCWAICSGPVSRPPFELKVRGFQGFRYVTEPLW